MNVLFSGKVFLYIFGLIVLAGLGAYTYFAYVDFNEIPQTRAYVTRDDVSILVSVSGKIEAIQSAQLSFPVVGVVQNVFKDDGDVVVAGDILASVTQDVLVANYNTALQSVAFLESVKNELVSGREMEARSVTDTNIRIAEENLARTKAEHARLVLNAHETLLSSDLEAIPVRKINDDIPPTISGTYRCATEGTYTISLYGSQSPTGYSYRLGGLETGIFTAYTDTAVALGNCGLVIQFDENERYRSEDWTVPIPNTRGTNYLTNLNAYKLALQQELNAVAAATQALELAQNTKKELDAPPNAYEIAQADARIGEARAQLAMHEAKIADYVIKAPFDGTITDSNIKVGEVAGVSRHMTILKEGAYELTARIPEVDITKVQVGQSAEVLFDAAPNNAIGAIITYIAPLATDIDGVAYYEAHLNLAEAPEWMRAGLNADVNITVKEVKNVLALPKRFVITENDQQYVLIPSMNETIKQPVQVGLTGNDGTVEILNLEEGTEVVAP